MSKLPPTGSFNPGTRELLEEVDHAYQLKTNEDGKLKRPVETIKLKESRRMSFSKRKKN